MLSVRKKKNSLQKPNPSRKNVPCFTINDPLPAEIEFKKKKKIINQTVEYQFSTFFSILYHARKDRARARQIRKKGKKKEKEKGRKKKFRVGETRVWLIQRWL